MRTPDVHLITEEWRFHCLRCLQVSDALYDARHANDGHGGDVVTWWLNGLPAQPPWIDPVCPNCHGFQVKVLPAGAVPRPRGPEAGLEHQEQDAHRRFLCVAMEVSSSGFSARPENQPYDVQVDETIRVLLDRAAKDGIAPLGIKFISNVTSLSDEKVTILDKRLKAAGLTTVLVDDRSSNRRPGTIRSTALHPHERAVMDQATVARSEAPEPPQPPGEGAGGRSRPAAAPPGRAGPVTDHAAGCGSVRPLREPPG
jgi:hypothetical protein